jgi:HPt (histidine-containing phosphotransfer) domain-containing protein
MMRSSQTQAKADMATPPMDYSALAQISGGDAAVEREFLAQFRAFNAEDSMALLNAAERSDLRGMQHSAHRIKGSASTIGALALAAAAGRVERACRDDDMEAARSHMGAFRAELERLGAYLEMLALPSPAQPGAPADGP